ncbi:hypothetical protein ACEZCY_14785 [Streptacidiphilus sp. N1-12]|uniref:Uncharacterized protein n=2 Tax=Streptacidiphilus alkalitolerans TaxID=3342712 RepID=A0ABV6WET0_9ACTN
MGADTVALVVVAVCGAVTGVFSFLQSRGASTTATEVQRHVTPPAPGPAPELTISPALHTEYTERLAEGERRESRLVELLRLAMRIIRRQNRRLLQAGLDPEPIPDELIPHSIG